MAPGGAPERQASTTTSVQQPRAANMTAMPSVPASSRCTRGSSCARPRAASARSTAGPAPSSHRLELPQPITAIIALPSYPSTVPHRHRTCPTSHASDAPQPAPPIRFHRDGKLRQVAPLPIHEEIHAFHAPLPVGTVGTIEEPADDQLALEIVGGELAQL